MIKPCECPCCVGRRSNESMKGYVELMLKAQDDFNQKFKAHRLTATEIQKRNDEYWNSEPVKKALNEHVVKVIQPLLDPLIVDLVDIARKIDLNKNN